MLNQREFGLLEEFVNKTKKVTVQDVVKYLKENMLRDNPLSNQRGDSHVHVIDPNRDKNTPVDVTRQKEQKRGFKLRTEAESQVGDTVRKGR